MLATILMAAAGCDKARGMVQAMQAASAPETEPSDALDLRSHPTILFQVFGESNDPRMIPIAAIDKGVIKPVSLSSLGWKQFDATFLRAGREYSLYREGEDRGAVRVTQGMWERRGEPLYALPGCERLVPLAAVQLQSTTKSEFTVELLAANVKLGHQRAPSPFSPAEVTRIAHDVSYADGGADINPAVLDALDFHAVGVQTGATAWPTIVASFIDPSTENATSTSTRTAHLLIVADRDSTGHYRPSFVHRVNGPLATSEFRRYFDHLDVDGDGTDEIALQGWQFGGETFLTLLSYKDGHWTERFRSRSQWCLDPARG
jgi:hypothetical protein